MIIEVKVKPNSSFNKITIINEKSIEVKLTATPVDGKANAQLTKLLSKKFKIAKSYIKIIRGDTGKKKLIEIPDNVELL